MLFDKEFEFVGKHARYCRALKEEVKLFATFREVYMYSTIIGFLHSRRADRDSSEKTQPASIFANDLTRQIVSLRNIYRFIMLLHYEENFAIDDYKMRAFKYDSDDNHDKIKKNMEIFNSYARGGVEFLYEKFKNCETNKDTANKLHEFLCGFLEDHNIAVPDMSM